MPSCPRPWSRWSRRRFKRSSNLGSWKTKQRAPGSQNRRPFRVLVYYCRSHAPLIVRTQQETRGRAVAYVYRYPHLRQTAILTLSGAEGEGPRYLILGKIVGQNGSSNSEQSRHAPQPRSIVAEI